MPPIMVTTCRPAGNSPPGHWATTPAASMPRTRGNVTPDARPWRVCNSDRFSPNALTSISTQPAAGVGIGSSRIVSVSGGPGASRTIARMVSVTTVLHLHTFPGRGGPLDGGDDFVAPDGIGEVGHGVLPVVDVRRECGVSTSDIEGGRAFQVRKRGPLLSQRSRDTQIVELVPALRSRDGQGDDPGERRV